MDSAGHGEPSRRAWTTGNADDVGVGTRGWFIGHFVREEGIRKTDDVEVKWFAHRAGDRREEWSEEAYASTVTILVTGRFRIDFADGCAVLRRPGDFAVWGPGIAHSWEAEESATVVTVRWPSQRR